MDHSYIEQHCIIDRYVTGKLSSAESAGFEEHFVRCPECQRQLNNAEEFDQVVKSAAANGLIQLRPNVASFPPRPSVAVRSYQFALIGLAAGLAFFIGTTFVLVKEAGEKRRDLDETKTAAAFWQGRYAAEHRAAAPREERMNGSAATSLPMVASIFPLLTVRGGDIGSTEPVNVVIISRSPQELILSVDRDDGPDLRNYLVTLSRLNGSVLWTQHQPVAAGENNLGVTLSSALFQEGDYFLTVAGNTSQGRQISRTYPFRVKFAP